LENSAINESASKAVTNLLSKRELIDNVMLMLKQLYEGKIIRVKVDLSSDTLYYEGLVDEIEVKALQELANNELVDVEIYDRVVSCPKCGSYRVKVKYVCPYCDSINLEKTRIIQHVACGFTGSEYAFYAKGKFKVRVCPNCGEEVHREGIDFIVLTTMFQCLKCGRRVAEPGVKFVCDKCGHEFSIYESNYIPLHSYKISELGKVVYERNLIVVALIEEVIDKYQFEKIKPPRLKGLSGIEHEFDIIGKKDTLTLLVDVIRAHEESKMLSVTVKAAEFLAESSGNMYYIVCYEELSPILSMLTNNPKVLMIKIGQELGAFINSFEEVLRKVLGLGEKHGE